MDLWASKIVDHVTMWAMGHAEVSGSHLQITKVLEHTLAAPKVWSSTIRGPGVFVCQDFISRHTDNDDKI